MDAGYGIVIVLRTGQLLLGHSRESSGIKPGLRITLFSHLERHMQTMGRSASEFTIELLL